MKALARYALHRTECWKSRQSALPLSLTEAWSALVISGLAREIPPRFHSVVVEVVDSIEHFCASLFNTEYPRIRHYIRASHPLRLTVDLLVTLSASPSIHAYHLRGKLRHSMMRSTIHVMDAINMCLGCRSTSIKSARWLRGFDRTKPSGTPYNSRHVNH